MSEAPARYDRFDTMPIAGKWREGSSETVRADRDPYTGDTLVEIRQADAEDVDAAYGAAKEAATSWRESAPGERAAVMTRAAAVLDAREEEVVDWLVAEAGSSQVKARAEVQAVRAVFLQSAGIPHRIAGRILPSDTPGKENRVYRRPVGVVTVISPWNWPLQLSNRSVAPALACGNAVVVKPAGDTPVTGGLLLAEILAEAGLPDGVLSVLVGAGSEIGDLIVQHPASRVVSFTGSTVVGRGIAEKAPLKRLSLELGGNGPLVVLDDADLEAAVDAAIFGKYLHQGQICMAINRIVVDDRVHDEFVDRFVERARALPAGDPRDADTVIGPIINDSQVESIRDKVAEAKQQGAEAVLEGDPTGPIGSVVPPHVLLGSNEVATAQQEVFGPVATVIRARDEQDALRIANDTELGLSSAVFTADVERGVRFALQVEAGMTHVNDQPVNDEANTAFGGEKESGLGRFGGDWVVEEFTTDHWISVQHTRRRFPF
jgi:aldehyde dehydrogenase (NAD+)